MSLEQQVQQLVQQMQALQAGVTTLRAARTGLDALPALVTALQRNTRPSLIDVKGLGKPFAFNGKEEDFSALEY